MSQVALKTNQKYLITASTLLLVQNVLIFVLIGISLILRQSTLLSLIQVIIFGLDVLGIALLGFGLYKISQILFTSVGGLFSEKSGLLLLLWVPLTILWRVTSSFFSSQFTQSLSTVSSMLVIFLLASIVFFLAFLNINKMIGRFREQGVILEGGGALYATYAVLNLIGVLMLTIGLIGSSPFLEEIGQIDQSNIDPNAPPDFNFSSGILIFLLLSGIGQLLKGLIVPILGILLFSQLRGVFKNMEFTPENHF